MSPPFDYVPASAEAVHTRARPTRPPGHHRPDAERRTSSWCRRPRTRTSAPSPAARWPAAPRTTPTAKPDTLQELALTIAAAGGPAYDAAYDRDGADARGIVAAFLYRTDRVTLAGRRRRGVLSADAGRRRTGRPRSATTPTCRTRSRSTRCCPPTWTRSTGVDGIERLHPGAAGGEVPASPPRPVRPRAASIWAISNHFSSGPDARVGQRTEQAAYGAAIVARDRGGRPERADRLRRRPERLPAPRRPDRRPTGHPVGPARAALRAPACTTCGTTWSRTCRRRAYSYTFQGQAQTLDNLFVNDAAARRPGADARRARQRRLARRLRRRRRARGLATTTRRWPASGRERRLSWRTQRAPRATPARPGATFTVTRVAGRCPSRSWSARPRIGLHGQRIRRTSPDWPAARPWPPERRR